MNSTKNNPQIFCGSFSGIFEGEMYPCPECDKKYTDRKSLQRHINAIHEGVIFPCPHCEIKKNGKAT